MSHLPERKEKDCLNCGATVLGRYCHVCGQENIEPKESIWQLVAHFFNDMTHFDGKVFTSMKDLVLKPGFLSAEYMRGKRASYLNPVRMYLFTSFVFFLIFFSFHKVDETNPDKAPAKKNSDNIGIQFSPTRYRSKAEFDSLVQSGKVKPNWLEKQLVYKNFELDSKYKNNPQLVVEVFRVKFMHSIPQILFILLPLFALYLKLMYRRSKIFYYTDHAIFTIHFYVFVFLDMLLILGISALATVPSLNGLSYVNIILGAAIFFYLYKAMRNFYREKRGRTIFKFLLLNFLFSLTGFLLLMIFVFLSIYQL